MGRVEKEVNEVVKGEEERRGGETVGGEGKQRRLTSKSSLFSNRNYGRKKASEKGN